MNHFSIYMFVLFSCFLFIVHPCVGTLLSLYNGHLAVDLGS